MGMGFVIDHHLLALFSKLGTQVVSDLAQRGIV